MIAPDPEHSLIGVKLLGSHQGKAATDSQAGLFLELEASTSPPDAAAGIAALIDCS